MAWKFAQETHVGKVREHNEDDHGCFAELGMALVADGMGGHAAGEVAAQMAVVEIRNALAQGASIEDAILHAQEAIAEAATGERHGMGTTVVVVREAEDVAEVAWCGDSRVYLWRRDQLIPVSDDHSLVGDLLRAALITPQMARVHPNRNIITNCLGSEFHGPQVVEVPLEAGDVFLLCSDGLTDELTDEEIVAVLASGAALQAGAQALVAAALAKGGRDNITVVLMQWTPAA